MNIDPNRKKVENRDKYRRNLYERDDAHTGDMFDPGEFDGGCYMTEGALEGLCPATRYDFIADRTDDPDTTRMIARHNDPKNYYTFINR